MKTKQFIHKLNEEKIMAVIAAAEGKTSGEIRVCISNHRHDDPVAAARGRFEKLGMTNTRERNGALIYFAPLSQSFAVIGDSGIHSKCGSDFWQSIASEMHDLLQKDQFTEAVILAVQRVGDALAKFFPRRPDDVNELPDKILSD